MPCSSCPPLKRLVCLLESTVVSLLADMNHISNLVLPSIRHLHPYLPPSSPAMSMSHSYSSPTFEVDGSSEEHARTKSAKQAHAYVRINVDLQELCGMVEDGTTTSASSAPQTPSSSPPPTKSTPPESHKTLPRNGVHSSTSRLHSRNGRPI